MKLLHVAGRMAGSSSPAAQLLFDWSFGCYWDQINGSLLYLKRVCKTNGSFSLMYFGCPGKDKMYCFYSCCFSLCQWSVSCKALSMLFMGRALVSGIRKWGAIRLLFIQVQEDESFAIIKEDIFMRFTWQQGGKGTLMQGETQLHACGGRRTH